MNAYELGNLLKSYLHSKTIEEKLETELVQQTVQIVACRCAAITI
jgi:hypothetical protein